MVYGFNNDRSKAELYTKEDIDRRCDIHNINVEYVGRLYHRGESDRTTSGCCMLDNGIIFTTIAHADNNESAATKIYKTDLKTGLVVGEYEQALGHCNDMCYNPVNGKVYVVRRWTTTDTNILICDPSNMSINSTIDTGVIVLGCAFDRLTLKQYVYCRNTDTSSFDIYEYDYVNDTLGTLVRSLPSSEILNKVKHYQFDNTVSGWQGMVARDGAIYLLFSGENLHYLLRVDINGDLIANPIDPCVFMFNVVEYEGIDFDEHGNLFFASRGSIEYQPDKFTVISVANISGRYVWSNKSQKDYILINNRYNIYVNSSLDDNYSIYQTGDTNAVFATAGEALKLASLNSHKKIVIRSLMTIELSQMLIDFPVTIEGSNIDSVLDLQGNKLEFWSSNVYLHQLIIKALLITGARYRLRFNWCTPSLRNVIFKLASGSTSSAMVYAECSLLLCDYLQLNNDDAPSATDSVISLNNNSNALVGSNVDADVTFLQPKALLS